MGSRTAELLEKQGETWSDGGRFMVSRSFVRFRTGGREYRIEYPVKVKPRSPNARERVAVAFRLPGDGTNYPVYVEFQDGGRRSRLDSFAVDYDLSAFIVAGEAMQNPPPERSGTPEYMSPEQPSDTWEASIPTSSISFDGDALRVATIEGQGWVSLPSLLEPFGKRVDATKGLLEGWARTRVAVLPSRMGESGNPTTTLIHVEDAPLLIARLDRRGMTEELKAKHARYLRHVARVLAEHFGLRPAIEPARPAAPADPWAAITALAGGAVQLKEDVTTAARAALTATRTAEEAKAIALEARNLAGSAGAVAAIARATPPGGSSETPDGAWSAKPPDGFKSMRSIARDFALPSDGIGGGFVGRVARALDVMGYPGAVSAQDVVIGGRARRQHITYGPEAITRMAPALRAAHATMVAGGFTVSNGVMRPAGVGPARRSKVRVLEEMFEAAAAERPPAPSSQTSIPGIDADHRKAG